MWEALGPIAGTAEYKTKQGQSNGKIKKKQTGKPQNQRTTHWASASSPWGNTAGPRQPREWEQVMAVVTLKNMFCTHKSSLKPSHLALPPWQFCSSSELRNHICNPWPLAVWPCRCNRNCFAVIPQTCLFIQTGSWVPLNKLLTKRSVGGGALADRHNNTDTRCTHRSPILWSNQEEEGYWVSPGKTRKKDQLLIQQPTNTQMHVCNDV